MAYWKLCMKFFEFWTSVISPTFHKQKVYAASYYTVTVLPVNMMY